MDSLRYWVREMHVDGFRFDLASTPARDTLESLQLPVSLQEALNRQELLDYLLQQGRFADRSAPVRRWSSWTSACRA
ncbi:MAG: hypothetical protein ACQET7_14550 [Thermodesulfobacteriota bacterium]